MRTHVTIHAQNSTQIAEHFVSDRDTDTGA
jgi:hypothetical protein